MPVLHDPGFSSGGNTASRTRASWRSLALFVVYLIAGNIVMDAAAVNRWAVDPWTRLNTSLTAWLASTLGFPALSDDTILTFDSTNLDVKQGCNGFHALLIFVSAVLASPAPWLNRFAGIVAGSPLILAFNVVRLVNLLLVARYYPKSLELFHVYIWQTLIMISAFGTFIAWGTLFVRSRKTLASPEQT